MIMNNHRTAKNHNIILFVALMSVICPVSSLPADDRPDVARWDFGTETTTVFSTHGEVMRDQAGPRAPEFPGFEANNTAIRLVTKGAYLAVADSDATGRFDFTSGDAITLEAWVKLDDTSGESGPKSPVYIVGKGRTGNPRVARDNQNWALRLVQSDDSAQISFLFATKPEEGSAHWHRWTSNDSLRISAGWHHVAVAYRFGVPETIRGWIDGQKTEGAWDMGGATTAPPIIDNDDVWIGSATKNNSFVGLLDSIAVHREILSDQVIAKRFDRVGEPSQVLKANEVMPDLQAIPKDRVLVTLSERFPSADRWLNEDEAWPTETTRWLGDTFLLPRIPLCYDDWGIRDDWKGPLLMRLAADVELARGDNRFLLRARGLSRLWVDGKLVASTQPVDRKSLDGEQPVTPLAQPPMPGLRRHGYHQQEVFGNVAVKANGKVEPLRCRVVLELIVGGTGQRTETGEVCVAVQGSNASSFEVLMPHRVDALPLTDSAVEPALERIEKSLASFDDRARREAASSMDAFWAQRHQAAKSWAVDRGFSTVLPNRNSESAHPIDSYIDLKIANAVSAAAATDSSLSEKFHTQVLPILRDNCFRCHGEKEKGGLKLNSRESVLSAGESELPAVVPGDPESSELISQIRSGSMPPTESGLTEKQIATLERWVRDGAIWPSPPVSDEQVALSTIINGESFIRRVYLDTVGVPPTAEEAKRFFADKQADKRERLIDRLLEDDRVADHWVSYWQDILAENPTLLNQSMGSTGPFRWFLYESLRDNKPVDRLITELIMMRGSAATGGSAAFALAGESDSPFAAKSHIVAAAFLGIELQCARCHDSPYHSTTQRDLYSLAAMMERKPVKVPNTSRVPDAFFEKKGRESLIKVTLKPDELIETAWPFTAATGIEDNEQLDQYLINHEDTRERLAALITAPPNVRFGRVIVNRIWKRLMGSGLVEPVDDWEGRTPSHPEMLDWLANELVMHGYDLRHLMRSILTSQAYMRQANGNNYLAAEEQRFFNAPDRRRLTAEQVVDSLYVATGNRMDTEELTFVHDGQRPIDKRQSLGFPNRAWMLAGLNNERDRPSLSLPKARAVTDVMEAFGWSSNRQKPISVRDTAPNVLQPGIIANGTLVMTLTRAAYKTELAQLAIEADSPERLVDDLFLRVLCRYPNANERQVFVNVLTSGFESRLVSKEKVTLPDALPELPLVTWFNHLQPETTTIQQELEHRVGAGPPADPRLEPSWRDAYEDFVWSLINHREFVWIP